MILLPSPGKSSNNCSCRIANSPDGALHESDMAGQFVGNRVWGIQRCDIGRPVFKQHLDHSPYPIPCQHKQWHDDLHQNRHHKEKHDNLRIVRHKILHLVISCCRATSSNTRARQCLVQLQPNIESLHFSYKSSFASSTIFSPNRFADGMFLIYRDFVTWKFLQKMWKCVQKDARERILSTRLLLMGSCRNLRYPMNLRFNRTMLVQCPRILIFESTKPITSREHKTYSSRVKRKNMLCFLFGPDHQF